MGVWVSGEIEVILWVVHVSVAGMMFHLVKLAFPSYMPSNRSGTYPITSAKTIISFSAGIFSRFGTRNWYRASMVS